MARRLVASIASVGLLAGPALAQTGRLIPPVDGHVIRGFDAPTGTWDPAHRGIDLGVPVGTPVRAAGPGTVTFAGWVAGFRAVSIAHPGGVVGTYSRLSEIAVARGDVIGEGRFIGRTGEAHPGVPGLHFGVRVEGGYLDPRTLLGPMSQDRAVHLVALEGDPDGCTVPADLGDAPPAPSGNVAVAVAGITSSSPPSPEHALHGAVAALGYPTTRIYAYSYAGSAGRRLHRRYAAPHTFGDIRTAAGRLRSLLARIARRHPGRAVDLIAHSQGGIVARAYLALAARSFDPSLPAVEHLVTFSSPHRGAPLARTLIELRGTAGGRTLVGRDSWLVRRGLVPDAGSRAVRQLAPGSELLGALAREDVSFGTRVLALGMAHDVVVPADRAVYDGEQSRTLPPEGLDGHTSIVTSRRALGAAHAFLRDAGRACPGAVDGWGRAAGAAIGWLERRVPGAVRRLEAEARGLLRPVDPRGWPR